MNDRQRAYFWDAFCKAALITVLSLIPMLACLGLLVWAARALVRGG